MLPDILQDFRIDTTERIVNMLPVTNSMKIRTIQNYLHPLKKEFETS